MPDCHLIVMSEFSPSVKIDPLESKLHLIDSAVAEKTGTGLLNWLTVGSIIASIYLFSTGKKQLGIFIGLWPPTFQALKKTPTD
jgi:hypothetical protein